MKLKDDSPLKRQLEADAKLYDELPEWLKIYKIKNKK